MRFRRWLRLADSGDFASFQVSTDNSNWTTVWSGTSVFDSSWTLQSYDLTIPAGESQLWLRWTIGPTTLLNHEIGWNIDDIVLRGIGNFDCDINDPAVTRVPSVVRDVQIDGSATLTWEGQSVSSGSSTAYELISGDAVLGLGEPSPVCLQNTTATSFADARTPGIGQAFYYLVRGWNSCGGGTFGSVARDIAFPDTDGDGPTDVCDP